MENELLQRRREQMFPKLTPKQIARLESHGRRVATYADEVLVEPGSPNPRFLVVLSGRLEASLPQMLGEETITELMPGDFAGELSTLRGVSGFVRIRVREAGEVLAIDDASLRKLVQTDAELSEMLMRAFILRRMGLIASGQGQVMLLGSRHSAATLRLREFLTRNAHPLSAWTLTRKPVLKHCLSALMSRSTRSRSS